MNATSVAPDVSSDVDLLLDAVYRDVAALRVNALAKGIGIRSHTIRQAIASGELSALMLSERGTVVPREAARRWLLALQRGPA